MCRIKYRVLVRVVPYYLQTKLFVIIDIFLYLDDPLYFGDLFLKLDFGTFEGCFLKIRLFPMRKLNFNSKKSYIFLPTFDTHTYLKKKSLQTEHKLPLFAPVLKLKAFLCIFCGSSLKS